METTGCQMTAQQAATVARLIAAAEAGGWTPGRACDIDGAWTARKGRRQVSVILSVRGAVTRVNGDPFGAGKLARALAALAA
jgi:hypothetical protein